MKRRLVSDGTVTIERTRIFSSENLYSRQLRPSSVVNSTWSVGSSSFAMTRIEPESPNSHRCASLCTSSHVKPASRLRNVSLSAYGTSFAPTLPTAMISPTTDGLLNVARGSNRSVYPWTWSAQACCGHQRPRAEFKQQELTHRTPTIVSLAVRVVFGWVEWLPAAAIVVRDARL